MFKNIFPLLGGFHMCKATLRCVGKYLKGSGIDDGLIESGLFGVKILEQVLSRSHYMRSLFGFLVIEECIIQLQWEAFWQQADKEKYHDEESFLKNLRYLIIHREDKKSKVSFWKAVANPTILSALLDDFKTFIDLKCMESEQCKYWQNALKMIGMVKCLIRAERDGDFLLHVPTVGNLLILFAGFDGLHYLRCGSFYYETKIIKNNTPLPLSTFLVGGLCCKN